MRAILFDRRGVGADHIVHGADMADPQPEVILWQARAYRRDGHGEHAGRKAGLYVECDCVVLDPGCPPLREPNRIIRTEDA